MYRLIEVCDVAVRSFITKSLDAIEPTLYASTKSEVGCATGPGHAF